jgi:hypothetical protein
VVEVGIDPSDPSNKGGEGEGMAQATKGEGTLATKGRGVGDGPSNKGGV